MRLGLLAVMTLTVSAVAADAPMNNQDVMKMVAAGVSQELVLTAIRNSEPHFMLMPAFTDQLARAGVSDDVVKAMAARQHGSVTPSAKSPGHYPDKAANVPSFAPSSGQSLTGSADNKFLLREGVDVPLKFSEAVSSKTATVGDPVTFVLGEDIKVDGTLLAKAGCKAFGEITNVKKSGMMGRAGELNVRLNYLKVGNSKVNLRGTRAREGEGKVGATVALTVLFGPIGLIKHGSNIEIKEGTAMVAYIAEDISLPPSL